MNLEAERKALEGFAPMVDEAERALALFEKAVRASPSNASDFEHSAASRYASARRREAAIHRVLPSVAVFPFDLPPPPTRAALIPAVRAERLRTAADTLAFMHAQWVQARLSVANTEAGVEELSREACDLGEQLESLRCDILLAKAAEMGIGDAPRPRESASAPGDGRGGDRERGRMDGESVWVDGGVRPPRSEAEAPPEYSSLAGPDEAGLSTAGASSSARSGPPPEPENKAELLEPEFDTQTEHDPDLPDGDSVWAEDGTVGPHSEPDEPPEYCKLAEAGSTRRRPLPRLPF